MLIITGHMHVDPADLAPFIADLKELATETRKRPGCIASAMMRRWTIRTRGDC